MKRYAYIVDNKIYCEHCNPSSTLDTDDVGYRLNAGERCHSCGDVWTSRDYGYTKNWRTPNAIEVMAESVGST